MAEAAWWQRGVIYQIYPRSFMDSDGDGVGDLPGVLSRLDHLTWLGVDALWLSPVYPSPMADAGYDVSDYRDVDPLFGSLDDLDRLVAAAHRRGLRVLLDCSTPCASGWPRGVDGFRIDVLSLLVEDDRLRDNPPNPHYRPGEDFPFMRELSVWNVDRPETRALAVQLRKVVDEVGDDRVLLAELVLPLEQTVAYYGADGAGIQVPFNFELLTAAWEARGIAGYIDRYLAALPAGGWPNWVLGNHDTPRVASRVGPAQARVAAMLLLTLPGTPILYQGDELGLVDVPIPPDRAVDPVARLIPGRGRDPERTPMPWDGGPGAGFTSGRPWLPVGDGNQARHVAAQRDDPASMLTLHRRLLRLRRATPALHAGAYHPVEADGDVLAYLRTTPGGARYLVALNLGPHPARLAGPALALAGRAALSTHPDRDGAPVADPLDLRGDEGVVVELG
jgi:alpha-glucosidase